MIGTAVLGAATNAFAGTSLMTATNLIPANGTTGAHGHDLADDLAQETFLKAWRKLRPNRSGTRFSTWLFGTAVNEFRRVARRRKELALYAED